MRTTALFSSIPLASPAIAATIPPGTTPPSPPHPLRLPASVNAISTPAYRLPIPTATVPSTDNNWQPQRPPVRPDAFTTTTSTGAGTAAACRRPAQYRAPADASVGRTCTVVRTATVPPPIGRVPLVRSGVTAIEISGVFRSATALFPPNHPSGAHPGVRATLTSTESATVAAPPPPFLRATLRATISTTTRTRTKDRGTATARRRLLRRRRQVSLALHSS